MAWLFLDSCKTSVVDEFPAVVHKDFKTLFWKLKLANPLNNVAYTFKGK